MRYRLWPFSACAAIMVLAGVLFLSLRVVILQVENLDRQRLVRIRLGSSGRFSLSYIHSMYDAPVIEELEILGDKIFLVGVRTKSPAVMEYYGFETVGELRPLRRELGEIRLRVSMGGAQRLSWGGGDFSLAALGASGDLIVIRTRSLPLGQFLIEGLWDKGGASESQRGR